MPLSLLYGSVTCLSYAFYRRGGRLPARGTATLRYDLPEPAQVALTVYDVLGREVARFVDGARQAGAHREPLDASVLPAGVYVVRL